MSTFPRSLLKAGKRPETGAPGGTQVEGGFLLFIALRKLSLFLACGYRTWASGVTASIKLLEEPGRAVLGPEWRDRPGTELRGVGRGQCGAGLGQASSAGVVSRPRDRAREHRSSAGRTQCLRPHKENQSVRHTLSISTFFSCGLGRRGTWREDKLAHSPGVQVG